MRMMHIILDMELLMLTCKLWHFRRNGGTFGAIENHLRCRWLKLYSICANVIFQVPLLFQKTHAYSNLYFY